MLPSWPRWYSHTFTSPVKRSIQESLHTRISNIFKKLTMLAQRSFSNRPTMLELPRLSKHSLKRHSMTTTQGLSEYECPMDVYLSEGSPLGPCTRFDWRLRAPSQPKGNLVSQDTPQRSEHYVKRVAPPYIPAQPRSPYFDKIQAYSKQFVPLLTPSTGSETGYSQVSTSPRCGTGRRGSRASETPRDLVSSSIARRRLLPHRVVCFLDGCFSVWTSCSLFSTGAGYNLSRASVPVGIRSISATCAD